MKQIRLPNFVGAILVQYTYSAAHMSVISMGMLSVTLWALTHQSLQSVEGFGWVEYWHFVLALICFFALVMFLDYVFLYPTRQAQLNIQSVKHTNPAFKELKAISRRLDRIERRLGITDDKDDDSDIGDSGNNNTST